MHFLLNFDIVPFKNIDNGKCVKIPYQYLLRYYLVLLSIILDIDECCAIYSALNKYQ